MSRKVLKISSVPDDLVEGLFGQVFLFVFEVLPYLDELGCETQWEIRSKLYGDSENDFIVIPGLIGVNTKAITPGPEVEEINLNELRRLAGVTMGNDWNYSSRLWNKFFRIPERIAERADRFPNLDNALGLHYRGTDKNLTLEETNYVSEQNFIYLVNDFLESHPAVSMIFIASDENSFIERVRSHFPNHRIFGSGAVIHHKDLVKHDNMIKGEHALLDCLLLSRCKYLLKCQSALSGFAKILNPNLEAYRVSANKLARWNPDTPYFPDAHIPKYSSQWPGCQNLLENLFSGDWTQNRAVAQRFSKPIPYEHKGRRRRLLSMIDRMLFDRSDLRLKSK